MEEDTQYLKAKDLAGRTGLPEKEVKRLLRQYGEYFTSVKQGRSRVYPPEAAGILTQITELEAVGTTVPTIRGILTGRQGGAEAGADPAAGLPVNPAAAAAGETLTLGALQDIKDLQETIGDLRVEVLSLREKVAEHEQKIIGHQQQLRLLRHEMDEQKTDTLARRMEERNTPFWVRLFGRKGA